MYADAERHQTSSTATTGRRALTRIATTLAVAAALIAGTLAVAPAAAAAPAPAAPVQAAPAAATATTATVTIASAQSTKAVTVEQQLAFDQEMIRLVNKARTSHGLPAVKEAKGLTDMALWWSNELVTGRTGGKLQHITVIGSGLKIAQTYGAANLSIWGENVGKLPVATTAQALFNAYWNSPSHKANILGERYRYIGMGTVAGDVYSFNAMEFTDKVESRSATKPVPGQKSTKKVDVLSAQDDDSCRPFPDVPSSYVHCPNVEWLKGQGITKPIGGKYAPASAVTRGQMMTFLHRLAHPGKPIGKCTAKPYADVPADDVFCGGIAWAKKIGILGGSTTSRLGIDADVDRGRMAAYMYRMAHPGKAAPKCTAKPFTDIATTHALCGYIAWAKATGISTGSGGGKYIATNPVTRGSMSSFLHRLHDYLQD